MIDKSSRFQSIILAGERPGGSPISHAFNVPASVMVPVAGKPSVVRVMQAIEDSGQAGGGIICGPATEVVAGSEELQSILKRPGFDWLAPAEGPAASALSALEKLNHFPALLTAGDHALLSGEIVDDFCAAAISTATPEGLEPASSTDPDGAPGYDLIIGFVPYGLVKAAWPASRRTLLKFSNGHFCGSNLFAIMTPDGSKALEFWRQAEADRKHPWRIARRFGVIALLLYLLRRLSLKQALVGLSDAAGCRIGYVILKHARAAVDVDSIEDQKLAERILTGEG